MFAWLYVIGHFGTTMTQPTKTRGIPDFPVLGFVTIGIQLPVVELITAVSAEIVILAVARFTDCWELSYIGE
jgi:hypothetical protein